MSTFFKFLITGIIALMVLSIMFFSTLIDVVHVEGHEAVVQQHWKKGVLEEVLGPGTHFIWPGYEYTQYKYTVGTQKLTFDDKRSNQDAEYERILVNVGPDGGQQANVALEVNYHIARAKVVTLHNQNLGYTYEAVVLKREVVDTVNEIARPYKSALDIYSGPGFVEFKNQVELALQKNVNLKDRGIIIEGTIIKNVYLDPKYETEIALKVLARQQFLTKEQQTLSAEQEAKRVKAEAQAEVEMRTQKAEAAKQERIKAAEAEKQEQVLKAQGEQEANLAKASGALAIGKANAEVSLLQRDALYAGPSGAWRARVEIAQAQAEVAKQLANKLVVVPEKSFTSLTDKLLQPQPVMDIESNN